MHWHEAPVEVPNRIGVEKVRLPAAVMETLGLSDDPFLYVCNKPSSVPVHPAGPYFANTLTLMVEAQEGLPAQSLKPIHRTDRVTSGLTLCCTNPALSALFHRSIGEGGVDKLYLARVGGKFPSSALEASEIFQSKDGLSERCSWSDDGKHVRVDAPVYTVDPASGLRIIDEAGKDSQSLFRRLAYDETSNTSLVSCFPVTGRNHQLRIHLKFLGHPIINDTQYDGRPETTQPALTIDSPVVKLMANAKNEGNERRVESLTDGDVDAAKRACPCCSNDTEGILKSFTARQLLLEGHAIHLHALRYRIKLWPKKSKHTAELPLAEIDLAVEPPHWAVQEALKSVDWLA